MDICYININRDTDMRYVLLIICLTAAVTHAGVYKWIDDNGKVHYSDTPAATQQGVEIDVDDSAAVPSPQGDDFLTREEKRERFLQQRHDIDEMLRGLDEVRTLCEQALAEAGHS